MLGFLKTTRLFPKIPEEFRSLPKTSEVFQGRPKFQGAYRSELAPSAFHLQKSEIARRVLSFIPFAHGFRSNMGLSLYIFGNCVKQDGNNSHFSTRREKLARKREPA